ncbi:hypothetical protein AVEN_146645-1 [Araneus ventricosus]|uniref:Uncharacterized protein n=1 Tax=Araneus ventricosus TaxID=182803 RepID=A0A4Y2WBL6_ARAVE|nr:hypothetical protein AVEN_146645-1 [Araneus ventricosus]
MLSQTVIQQCNDLPGPVTNLFPYTMTTTPHPQESPVPLPWPHMVRQLNGSIHEVIHVSHGRTAANSPPIPIQLGGNTLGLRAWGIQYANVTGFKQHLINCLSDGKQLPALPIWNQGQHNKPQINVYQLEQPYSQMNKTS